VPFFSALAFVAGIAVLVLLAEPPAVIVAIIAVIVVGVLLTTFVPSPVWRGARRGVKNRAYRPQGATTDPVYDQES
jgi:hypothetical protein